MLDTLAVLIGLTALCAYLNHRLSGLPMAIGVMSLALLGSAGSAEITGTGENNRRVDGCPSPGHQ